MGSKKGQKPQRASWLVLAACMLWPACTRSKVVSEPEPKTTATKASAAPTPLGSIQQQQPATAKSSPPNAREAPPQKAFETKKTVDVVVRGARIIDGTGKSPFTADVVVDNGTIQHIGQVAVTQSAKENIDAAGRILSPGFIDAHSHASPSAPNAAALTQGITTVCIGQDGNQTQGLSARSLARKYARGTAVNVVPLAGHATLRQRAKIGYRTKPNSKKLRKLVRLVEAEMKAGAFGLSNALEYTPGRFAQREELRAVAEPVARYNGVIMSHLRSEDNDRIDAAINELVDQATLSGAKVHIAHIKIVYAKGKKRAREVLERMARARRNGVRITADIYPYLASYTGLSILFPAFARPPHNYRAVARSQRPKLASALRRKVTARGGPAATLFGTGAWRGKTLAEAAQQARKPFEDILIDLGPAGASAAYFVMNDELQWELLRSPFVMVSTDGGEHSRHPRGHGSFARALRIGIQKAQLSLTEMIRKMTALPAATLGLDGQSPPRGQVRTGWAADLLLFDPAKVRARATYLEPQKRSLGFDWVLVNGSASVARGRPTSQRHGRVLIRSPSPNAASQQGP